MVTPAGTAEEIRQCEGVLIQNALHARQLRDALRVLAEWKVR